jgi:hypothetical protein
VAAIPERVEEPDRQAAARWCWCTTWWSRTSGI